jgi:hypothetical protein
MFEDPSSSFSKSEYLRVPSSRTVAFVLGDTVVGCDRGELLFDCAYWRPGCFGQCVKIVEIASFRTLDGWLLNVGRFGLSDSL